MFSNSWAHVQPFPLINIQSSKRLLPLLKLAETRQQVQKLFERGDFISLTFTENQTKKAKAVSGF